MKAERGVRFGAMALVATLLLDACASTPAPQPIAPVTPQAPSTPQPPPPPPAPKFTATPGLSARERVLKILKLLDSGDPAQARAEVEELLKEDPTSTLAQSLYDQIDKDPQVLFGEKHFSYTIQPGDSLSLIAQRFLGDRFLFYALARYNNIEKPSTAAVGQTIQIPGVPTKSLSQPRKRLESEAEAVESRLSKPAPAQPAVTPPAAAHDPVRASKLRGQALAALNGGAADRAVALFRQAAALDPDNTAIKRDLARAERIQAALRK